MAHLSHKNKWLNPQDFKDNKEFMRAYNILWARAKVAQEIEELLLSSTQRVMDIQKRMEKERVNQTSSTR